MKPAPTLALAFAALLAAAPVAAQTADSLPPDRWIAPDKPAHVFAGYWTAGAGWIAADALGGDFDERRAAALTAGLTAGLAKEAFDKFIQHERFSWKDLLADTIGIALFLAVSEAAP